MKKRLSILLVCAMLISCVTPVFADEEGQTTTVTDNIGKPPTAGEVIIQDDSTTPNDDENKATDGNNENSPTEGEDEAAPSTGKKTEDADDKNQSNTDTESETKASDGDNKNEKETPEDKGSNSEKTTEEIISELPVAKEYSEEQELPEEETTLSEDEKYMLNIVLFTLSENTELSYVKGDLKKLGLREITPVFTNEDGTPKAIGKKNEIWYRAYTNKDANDVTKSLIETEGVTYAEPEYVYTADSIGEPTETEQTTGWIYNALLKHNSDFWWYTALNHDFAPGKDTIVAVIDTGVDYTHEDLAANMWVNDAELNGTPGVDDDGNGVIDDIYGADVTATGAKKGNPMDDNGHGTHVAGIIGMSPNGVGGVGLAYGAKVMAIKAGQSTGTFSSTHIANAINYAHMMGADVINMSFGGASKSYLVETALEDAFSDCVLAASAGNDGLPTTDADPVLYSKSEDIYPAGYTYVLGVMATDIRGNLASFSNWDYNPNANCEYELTAPGVDIYSTLPGNRYAKWSGTSMAAPCVSAAAAIIRSNYSDKSMYSARFIMGQLASATKSKTYFTAPMGESYTYSALNIYDSINYLPKPNITVKDTFLMDNKELDEANDGDAIIDAGETIDLGVLVRNQWGLTGDITVKADAISVGGVANPYIEFLTDEVTLQPAGTFQEVNNGFVYDDNLLTSVSNPIRFKVANNTPNGTEICINITVTTTNGADERDTATYTTAEPVTKTFRVQAGRGIQGTLTEDTTLTNDYLWIIENSLLIPEGITLTIEPGTKVQFYSADYEDAYGGKTVANINCEGTLNAIGTEDEPIEMYPGAGFEDLCVQIGGTGIETLKYCKITNPYFGKDGLLNVIDHCELTQQYANVYCRSASGTQVKNGTFNIESIGEIKNSVVKNLACRSSFNGLIIYTLHVENSLFENCAITWSKTSYFDIERISNNVFVENQSLEKNGIMSLPTFPKSEKIYITKIRYSDEVLGSKYVSIKAAGTDTIYKEYLYGYYAEVAKSLGGNLMVINSDEEKQYILSGSLIGARFNPITQKYEWIDGSNYEIDTSRFKSNYTSYNLVAWYLFMSNAGDCNHDMMIEVPYELDDDEILLAIENFDYEEYLKNNQAFTNNAILNPVLNNDTKTWTKLQANSYNADYAPNYATGNYWGTENKTLINKMIIDADDYAGTYQDIIEDPILTLESPELENIYPFVTKVYMTDSEGNIVQNVSSGDTYNVHVCFNRDMDTETQPSVTFGGEAPYTDYTVSGDFISAREWVGSVKISPFLTGGTMYWRTKGGVTADDKWLECGEDVLRFSFNIGNTGALAMLLNADGGANKVELSWAQNDYETLAGYNIYRSKNETSGFEKLNLSVLTDNSYTDTDVEPGVTYYYYFKVVNTDGNEEENVSNTASGTPIDNIYPILKHTPVTSVKAGSAVTISATATDNIGVESVKLYYRKSGESKFTEQKMTLGATENLYVARIPASAVKGEAIEYYVAASDADGNITYNGTANIPNVISINSEPYILSVTPTNVAISGGRTVTILGGNFTEDMVLKVGGEIVAEKSFIDQGQITFIAPSKASGTYAITLTQTDGKTVTAPKQFSYTDSESTAEIPTSMTMTSGTPYTIPFYATASGDIISVHAELDLPSADFTSVKVEKADKSASFTLDYSYSSGTLKIGYIGSSNINGEGALLNIIVTPKVNEDKQYSVKLHDVAFNGVAVANTISGEVIIKPSFEITATVKYFNGSSNFVKGVIVSASGVNAETDEKGTANLTVPKKEVVIHAKRNVTAKNAVTAYDASLVLQSAIGKVTLSDNQKKAADVDGSGVINEYDAALILQMAVKKLDAFPVINNWVFVPASIEKTLSFSSTTAVSFTAISLGDVDGSFKGEEE